MNKDPKIYCGDSSDMEEVEDSSIDLIITSPPYNVGKSYEGDMVAVDSYMEGITPVFRECWRVLKDGGRICINIANTGRNPYQPLTAYYTMMMLDLGFRHRGEIIWAKPKSTDSTAWGSYCSPANPVLRDIHEYILCFSKAMNDMDGDGTDITVEEFAVSTLSIWNVRPESATRIGHPAPFPIEIPKRLILLYSFQDAIVLDPFTGSGTTAIACMQTGRAFIGYEREPKYVDIARSRIAYSDAVINDLFGGIE